MAMIEDGTGSRKKAGVSNDQRLRVRSISEPITDSAGIAGDKYNINTGDITLTTAGESAVLYIKNNEDKDLIITALIYNFGTSDGIGDWKVTVWRNPNAGTIINNATNVEINSNMNYGSANIMNADTFKGVDGDTVNGERSIESRVSGGRVVVALGAVILPKGQSLAVTYIPPSGNTSATVNCAASCYLLDQEMV